MKGLCISVSLLCLLLYGNSVLAQGTISGSTSLCVGSSASYTVSGSTATTGYNWSIPGGASITSGAGSRTVTISFATAGNGLYIGVTGNGLSTSTSVTVYARPTGTGVISGPGAICPGQTGVMFSVSGNSNVASYTWFATNGATITNGSGTSSIKVSFPSGYTGGTVGVTPTGGMCPPAPTVTKSITVGGPLPAAAGTISGTSALCPGQTGVAYSVPVIANATGYVWSLPAGASIASGSNTNSITVNFSSSPSNGNVSVYGTNCMGNGTSSSKAITITQPVQAAGTISGATSICAGNSATYSVPAIANATGYQWMQSEGNASITSGSNTRTITLSFPVNYTAASLTLRVFGTNGCGTGAQSSPHTVTVYKMPVAASSISGATTVCPGQNGVAYSVASITNASGYAWSLPSGASIASGSNTRNITVNFSSSYAGGNISVSGTNSPCSAGAASSLFVAKLAAPAAAGAITGSSAVCVGQTSVTYSVPVIPTATGYIWSLPTGAAIASGSNTNQIVVNFSGSAVSGNIRVYGTNCIGNGTSSSKPITVNPLPTITSQPVSVTRCETANAVLTVNASNATSYLWCWSGSSLTDKAVPPTSPPWSGRTTNQLTVSNLSSGIAGQYWVRVTNACGTILSNTATVTVVQKPSVTASNTGPACVGTTIGLTSTGGFASYAWTGPNSFTSTSQNPTVSTSASTAMAGTYTVTVTDASGCSNTASTTVTVNPLPTFTVSNNGPACLGLPLTLTGPGGMTSYSWTGPNGFTSTIQNPTVSSSATAALAGTYTLQATNSNGCRNTASTPVTVIPAPTKPNAIMGNKYVCGTASSVVYSIDPVASATTYNWTVPTGATIASGQNTTSITVNFSSSLTGGSIAVTAQNCSGTSAATSLQLSVDNEVGGRGPSPSVDPVTGIMSTSIPLFMCQDGDVTIPVNLSYTASGVRVTDTDGFVGHNWNLSVLSYRIAREVRGLPDDYAVTGDARKGWLYGTKRNDVKNFTISNDNNSSTCSDEFANHTFLNSIGHTEDTEPDAYFVSGPGISFEFYFDENRVPQVMPYQDVVITPYTAAGAFLSSTTSGPVTSFTVVDNQGFKYTFAEVETMTESLQESNNYYLSRYSKMHLAQMTYATSWRLTSVLSPTHGMVTFTYKTVNTNDINLAPSYVRGLSQYKLKFPNGFGYSDGLGDAPLTMYHGRLLVLKILQTISSPSMEAVFTSAPKNTESTDERLTSIDLFEKRSGVSTLIRSISFQYTGISVIDSQSQPLNYRARTYLERIHQTAGCFEQDYTFQYYGNALPKFDSKEKDDWGFYVPYNYSGDKIPYDETVIGGTLKRIVYPYKGYDVFFYEPHDYWNGTTSVQGGGIRLRKMLSFDGVSADNNIVKEYEYKKEDGTSSGKLQYRSSHRFNAAVLHKYNLSQTGPPLEPARYQQIPGTGSQLDNVFRIKSEEELDHNTLFRGSVVAYERVTVSQKDAGKIVYEFDLPASYGDLSANSGEWQASKVLVARPSSATCFQIHNVEQGANVYPFPPNPNYDFAKGLLKKETSFNEAGTKVKDVVYNYQRVYGNGSGINKIFGLAIEELPTYYYNGSSYVDNTMFVFSKYEIYTGVKSEPSSIVETVYNSADLLSKTVKTTTFSHTSPNHRELTRIVTTNSDGSQSATTLKYVKDYIITTPSGTPATALANLKTANRNLVVETMNSKISAGIEKYTGASLTLYQTLSGKAYPHMQYNFHSSGGTTAFVPSSILTESTFTFDDTKYILDGTFLSFDNYGNPAEIKGKDRSVSSVITGFNGTVPILSVENARADEFKYSDFDASTSADFILTWNPPTYSAGRNNTRALNLPAGSGSQNLIITSNLSYNNTAYFIFSCWIKASSAGTFSVLTGTSTTTATYTFPFTASEWKYYTLRVPIDPIIGTGSTFFVRLWSNAAIQVDDLALYPEHAAFIAYSYQLPFGKKSETDSRGNSRFYEYDPWGRLRVVYDREKNITNVYEFKAKPY